jgi:hypothetical protein
LKVAGTHPIECKHCLLDDATFKAANLLHCLCNLQLHAMQSFKVSEQQRGGK